MTERRLYEALVDGRVDILKELMEADKLILSRTCVNYIDQTPLHIAVLSGHVECVKEVLLHKPDLVNERDSQRFSPLHLASANGYVEILKELLKVNPDVCLFQDEDGRTPLHLAVMKGRVEVINELVKCRREVIQQKLNQGETLLHSCVKYNRLEALKLLVKVGGVDDLINDKDHGFTILHMATALKRIEIIKYLIDGTGVEVNAVNGNGFTALDMIEQMPRDLKVMEIREYLQNAGAKNLHAASARHTHRVPASDVPPTVAVAQPPSRGDSIKKQKEHWLKKKRDALMVATSVIAAMAYQAGLNPPGGVWQEDSKTIDKDGDPNYLAGESVMAYQYPNGYATFSIMNTVSFLSSLSILLLLVSGIPMKQRIFMWILMVAMWVTITSMAVTYLFALQATRPFVLFDEAYTIIPVIKISLYTWLGVVGIVVFVQTIRFIIWSFQKVKNLGRHRLSTSATQGQAPGNA